MIHDNSNCSSSVVTSHFSMTRQEAQNLLYKRDESIFKQEEDIHPWRTFLFNPKFDKPLMRVWDACSGSQPTADDYMLARVIDMRLDDAEQRKDTLGRHLNNRDWTPSPYISFTSSYSAVESLVAKITKSNRPRAKMLTVINPNVRIEGGMPILRVEPEMDHYKIAEPYGCTNGIHSDHYVCLWQVNPDEIVGHWNWEEVGDDNWYEQTILPAFKKHNDSAAEDINSLQNRLNKLW